MIVTDVVSAEEFLRCNNYYRFSAYCLPFQSDRDVFIPGSSFEKVAELYLLDEELRLSMLRAISPVEIYLRTKAIYELSHGWGPFALYNRSLFRSSFKYDKWLEGVEEEINRSKETFIKHYNGKYDGYPRLPIWMACEVMSMGSLSLLYSGLMPDPQRKISSPFEVSHAVLVNWLHVITYIRNICAHHSRLWNRELAIRPEIPRKNKNWINIGVENSRLYAFILMIEWMQNKAKMQTMSLDGIYQAVANITAIDDRFARMMGIPQAHAIGPFWKQQK